MKSLSAGVLQKHQSLLTLRIPDLALLHQHLPFQPLGLNPAAPRLPQVDPEKCEAKSDEATSRAVVKAAGKVVSQLGEEEKSKQSLKDAGDLLEMANDCAVQRHANKIIASGVGECKKQIPSALSGLDMSGKPP
jgi:hypothetical protein